MEVKRSGEIVVSATRQQKRRRETRGVPVSPKMRFLVVSLNGWSRVGRDPVKGFDRCRRMEVCRRLPSCLVGRYIRSTSICIYIYLYIYIYLSIKLD